MPCWRTGAYLSIMHGPWLCMRKARTKHIKRHAYCHRVWHLCFYQFSTIIRCLVSLCPPVSKRSRLRHPASRHLHYSKFWLLSNSLVLPQELERLHVSQLSGQFFQVVVVRFQHLQVTTPAYASRVSNSRDTQKEQGVRIVHAEVVTSKPSHPYKDSLAFQCRCIRRRP